VPILAYKEFNRSQTGHSSWAPGIAFAKFIESKEVYMRSFLFVCMIMVAPFTFAQGFMIDPSSCDFHKLVNDHLATDDTSMSEGSAQWYCRLSSETQIRCAYNVISKNPYLHNVAGFSAVMKGCAESERLHFDEHAF
jgi:hypothetical protein